VTEQIVLDQRIKLPYRYTAGDVQKAFLRGLVDEKLVGSQCEECDRVLFPARPFCPFCSSSARRTVELPPAGLVTGWTTVTRSEGPATFVLVRIDGADTDVLHRWVGEGEPVVGRRAGVRWAGERDTEITAIDGFTSL
jgi:uncharacterized OB-fold protein